MERSDLCKVLIADDEHIIRRGLHSILDWNALGYTIAGEAASGSEVLRKIPELNPALILMDIRMPGLNGLETIRQARENGYEGHFIVLSGYSDFHYAQTAIRYGVRAYLTKPVDVDDLTKALEQVLKEIREKDRLHDSQTELLFHARTSVLSDLLLKAAPPEEIPVLFHDMDDAPLNNSPYQVILYEKFSRNLADPSYSFAELLRSSDLSSSYCDELTLEGHNVLILRGEATLNKFESVLARFESELPPEKNSPFDSIFLTCGRRVNDITELNTSYADIFVISKPAPCISYS